MKKIIIFIIFSSYLISAPLNKTSSYQIALSYYKKHNFQDAYNIFHKIYLQNLSNINFNFYFGKSAYETGHYEMALAAFERVQMQDSSSIRNELEMARTYFMLKMYEDAENIYREILVNPNLPENIRTKIELSLSKVSKVQKKSFTYARVMMDVLYDSNVNYGSIDDYQYGGGILNKIKPKSDTAIQMYGDVTNIYDIGDKNGYAIKNSLSLYLKDYSTENNYNIAYIGYFPSLIYKTSKYVTEMELGIDDMSIGGTNYLYTLSIKPKLKYNHTYTLSSIIYFKYQDKNFIQDAQKNLDSSRYELSYGLQKILNPHSYIKGALLGINEAKIRGNNIYVNFDEYVLNIIYANQFSSKYSFDLFAQTRVRSYRDYSNGFESKRKDVGTLSSAGFTVKLLPTLRANIKASYEYVNSNQDRFTYKKFKATTGIIKTF